MCKPITLLICLIACFTAGCKQSVIVHLTVQNTSDIDLMDVSVRRKEAMHIFGYLPKNVDKGHHFVKLPRNLDKVSIFWRIVHEDPTEEPLRSQELLVPPLRKQQAEPEEFVITFDGNEWKIEITDEMPILPRKTS